jgi:predicted cupin superfamily sugar epimerase
MSYPLAEALDLQPHPEGGWYAPTWRADVPVAPDGYSAERACASAIYFLLCPGEESRWHRVRSDELWLFHRGGGLRLLLGGTGEAPESPPREVLLGAAVECGERPQVLVPGGTWQAAHPADPEGTDPVLVSCVVSPGFEFADFELF